MANIAFDECVGGCDLKPYVWEPMIGPLQELAWPRETGHVGTVGGAFVPIPHRFRFVCVQCRKERWLSMREAEERGIVVFSPDEGDNED